jgi:hypothetical protein
MVLSILVVLTALVWISHHQVAAQLNFIPVEERDHTTRDLQKGGSRWGQFHYDGYCVQKVPNLLDGASSKVKFLRCDSTVPAQLWQFENGDYFNAWYGLLYNRAGGCLTIRGATVEAGKNLRVLESCDATKSRQQWWADGDTLNPFDHQWRGDNPPLCVSAQSYRVRQNDPVKLRDCQETDSLDYGPDRAWDNPRPTPRRLEIE